MSTNRPTSVTVIGWISIALAGFLLLVSFGVLVSIILIKPVDIPQTTIEQAPLMFKPLKVFTSANYQKYAAVFNILQIILAIFILISSIQFLRFRSWAKRGLETIYWLEILLWIIFFIFFFWQVTSSIAGTSHETIFIVVFGILTLLITALNVSPFIILVVFLRVKTIREAFAEKV